MIDQLDHHIGELFALLEGQDHDRPLVVIVDALTKPRFRWTVLMPAVAQTPR